jgi:hypothetical protein
MGVDVRRIIHAVKGWIKGSTPKHKPTAIIYVHSPGKEASGADINPNDQITILRRLSTFTAKEDIAVTVIMPGRPNRKIPDGTKQGDVQVCYAMPDQLRKVVDHAIREAQQSRTAVLATNNTDLEAMARHNRLRHIRATTFERTLDTVCGPLRREQPQQQQPRRQPQQQPQSAPATKPAPVEPESAPAETVETSEEPAPIPAPPKPDAATPRKLQKYTPPVKKEERDQAILDLIDPL